MVQIAHFHSQFKKDLVPFDPDDACIFRIDNDHSRAFLRELPPPYINFRWFAHPPLIFYTPLIFDMKEHVEIRTWSYIYNSMAIFVFRYDELRAVLKLMKNHMKIKDCGSILSGVLLVMSPFITASSYLLSNCCE